jgi:large subunit ribosomal protein L18
MQNHKKKQLQQLRRYRIRKKISGSGLRPRMAVKFSNEHIYVTQGQTLASASTRHKSTAGREQLAANVESAKKIGTLAAEAAKGKGIAEVVFDRAGARYHGKVKALADAAREAGLKF